jgi:two-component system, sensor histidine kinase
MPRSILVVDDSQDAADSFASVLRALGHEARVAYDGRNAIAAALAQPPEVVFVDLGMPWIDGYDLLREFRDLPGMDQAKLICVTGFGDARHRNRALEYGCDGYLVKPIELEDVEVILGPAWPMGVSDQPI